jgi:hypothetical protein
MALGRLDEAMQSFDRATDIRPDLAEAWWDKAATHLLLGDFEAGWRLFEWRWQVPGPNGLDRVVRFAEPLWTGREPLEGKTIVLYAEQGLGDTIQFVRYAELVAARGARVLLAVPKPLMRLVSALDGVDQVVDGESAAPAIDYQCPMLSLPLAFGTTLATVPARVPYLNADREESAAWRQRLPRVPGGLRIGLVWAGGHRPENPHMTAMDARRSLPLARLAPLAQPGVEFVSLQKGERAEAELRALAAEGGFARRILDVGAELGDFATTAALIDNLDLVISVDTAVAHLAGAMGKPVWLLNRADTDWRWMLGREDSPWYPTMRIFRQTVSGDWGSVIAAVREALLDFSLLAG